jgi:hypothetical protein
MDTFFFDYLLGRGVGWIGCMATAIAQFIDLTQHTALSFRPIAAEP